LGGNITGADFNAPSGVAVTNNGTLWVADTFNYYLKRFDTIFSSGNYPNPNGLLGTGASSPVNASNMAFPNFISVDKANGNLFISDLTNGRVMLYLSAQTKGNFSQADKVFGQPSFTDSIGAFNATCMVRPNGVFYDSATDSLFVTDQGTTNERSRVLIWTNTLLQPNGSSASFVIGRSDFSQNGVPGTPSGSNFNSPYDVSYSIEFPGLFMLVVDQGNNRVVRFSCTNSTFTSTKSLSKSVPATSPGSSSGAPLSSSPPVAASSSGAIAPSSSGAVVASSSGAVAVSSSGAVAASSGAVAASSGAVAASSGAVAASSGAVAASSGAVAASSAVVGTQSRSKSGAVAASSGAVAASSGAVAASSGAVAASSGAVAASSGAVAASSGAVATQTRSKSKSQSNTPSETNPVVAASSGVVAASSGATGASSVAARSLSAKSVSVAKSRTLTGLAAITCRQSCQAAFFSCKRTTRRLRICRRAKKQCVANCGTVNPNRH